MGTTAAGLHILNPDGGTDVAGPVAAAYRKIGYTLTKNPRSVTRRTCLIARSDFVSLHDSGNDAFDTGELKEIAVAISKSIRTVVIVTSVLDSDSFEFLIYDRGKQIDAAVSDRDSHTGGLRFLEPKKRARAWAKAFQYRDLIKALKSETRHRDETALLRGYEQGVAAAAAMESPFAENILGAWCAAAGLAVETPTMTLQDCIKHPSEKMQILEFATAAKKTKPVEAPNGVQIAFAREDDDCPYHRFYPAAWPLERNATSGLRWFLVSSGVGFRGLRIKLDTASTGEARVTEASIVAFPFYNGQMTSMTAVAQHTFTAVAADADGLIVLDAPEFEIPGPSPHSRRQFIVIVTITVTMGSEGEVELAPSLEIAAGDAPMPDLPILRVAAHAPRWMPYVAGDAPNSPAQRAILQLNAPSCMSHLAILPGDDAQSRNAFRRIFETLLSLFTQGRPVRARVLTQKHMSQTSFSVLKNDRFFDLTSLRGDRAWERLFDASADYQTVAIELFPTGAIYPRGGFVMQATLRNDGVPAPHRQTLTGGAWMIDHPEVYGAMGCAVSVVESNFTDWVHLAQVRQAWSQSAAWIPEFDIYDDYRQTPYEQASTTDWFASALNGEMATSEWLDARLRTIAPMMWVEEKLIAGVDRIALTRIATSMQIGEIIEIRLREGASLNDLERVFAARLPLVARAGA